MVKMRIPLSPKTPKLAGFIIFVLFFKLICTFSNFLLGVYAGQIALVRTIVVTQQ